MGDIEPMPDWYVVLRQTADEDGAPEEVRDACRVAADRVDSFRRNHLTLARIHAEQGRDLARTQAAGDALVDGLDRIGGWDPEGIGGLITGWRSVREDAPAESLADKVDAARPVALGQLRLSRDAAGELRFSRAAPTDDTAVPDQLTWPGVASAPGSSDEIIAEIRKRWPEHARLHGLYQGDAHTCIDFAVHVTVSMLQQDPRIATEVDGA